VNLAGLELEGRYKVVRPIARGALATVYLAYDTNTPLALKVFPPGFEGRAEREWKVGQVLNHPRINPVLGRLTVPHDQIDHPAVLLAYAPGARLYEWRKQYPTQVIAVFKQLLEALAYMHDQGLVHRDIKPDNLVVDSVGDAKLVDFDLSGPASEPFTQKVRLGTIAYIAPEQVRGESPTAAADIYSAGVLLYWCLRGQLPFEGKPKEVLQAHLNEPLPKLVVAPETGLKASPVIQFFLERLMHKDPEKRPPNGTVALEEFQSVFELLPR
jgi:eukaryotic-like serine/threonine-protein kinase